MKQEELFALLEERIVGIQCDHPIRIGINGVDGAGKTTFADRFAAHLKGRGKRVIRASIDSFHNPKVVRYQDPSPEGYYRNCCNLSELIKRLLLPLGPAGELEYQSSCFDYMTDSWTNPPTQIAQPNDILLFDGIFLFTEQLAPFWDFSIFLDVPFDVILERVQHRGKDIEYHGSTEVVRKYRSRYIPAQQIYLERDSPKEKADVVINNVDFEDPVIVY